MSEYAALRRQFEELLQAVADLKMRVSTMVQVGLISDMDAVNGYRLEFGDDGVGGTRKSPWLPHPESGGEASTWMPLSKGQIMAMIAPGGDPRQAFLVRAGFGGDNHPPSQDLGEVVLVERGDVRVSAASGRFTVKVGGASLELTPDKFEALADLMQVTGSTLRHNAKSVGDTHGHVTAPPGPPGAPV